MTPERAIIEDIRKTLLAHFLDSEYPFSGTGLPTFCNLTYGGAEKQIAKLSLLYDESAEARQLLHSLLQNGTETESNRNNRHAVIAYFLKGRKEGKNIHPAESLQLFLDNCKSYTIRNAFETYAFILNSFEHLTLLYATEEAEQMIENKTLRENTDILIETIKEDKLSIKDIRSLIDLLYKKYQSSDYQTLFDLLAHSNRLISKKATELIREREEAIRGLLEQQLTVWKEDTQAKGRKIIKWWDNDKKYGKEFNFTNHEMIIRFCEEQYDTYNNKQLKWIPDAIFGKVHFADTTTPVPPIVIKYLIAEYLTLDDLYRISICDKIAGHIRTEELQNTFTTLCQLWVNEGAPAKKKNAAIPYILYGSGTQLMSLTPILRNLGDSSRAEVATYLIQALSLSPEDAAIHVIHTIAQKTTKARTRNAAAKAFSEIARHRQMPEEKLLDKVIPPFGFDAQGKREFSYGTRTFTITLLPGQHLQIFDNEKQKIIHTLPAPNKNDDKELAKNSKKEFSALKKQIKDEIQTQGRRLEKTLLNERDWSPTEWEQVFIQNPFMQHFACSLIWGIHENRKLQQTFRYMNDGTFSTVTEESIQLPETGTIALIHPRDLTPGQLNQWQQQLDDYEILQPIRQLSLPLRTLQAKEISDNRITRYIHTSIHPGKLLQLLKENRDFHELPGEGIAWSDPSLNLLITLDLSSTIYEYLHSGQDLDCGKLSIYKLPEQKEQTEKELINPLTLSPRFINAMINTFDKLTGLI